MSPTLTTLLLCFAGFMLIGVPIAFSIGIATVMAMLVNGRVPLMVIPQRLFNSTDSFSLLAIPFFIFVGDIMMHGGISKRLINLAVSFFGWAKGCLAYCTVVASAFFGAISGSAPATAAAIGGMMYPEMLKAKYDPDLSAFIGAVSGTLGVLIPPSIPFVIFGTQTGTSVSKLFLVGAVAGSIIAAGYCLAALLSIRKDGGIAFVKERPKFKTILAATRDAFWGLLSPVIILGGIYSGQFTPTEAAVIATAYSLIVGFFIYRELTLGILWEAIVKSCLTAGMVLLLVSVASVFSWILTVEGVARMLQQFVVGNALTGIKFLLAINAVFLLLGMIMDTIPIIILTAPIFTPIAASIGIDRIHLGALCVVNLAFGMVTPPFGINLFVASGYSRRTLGGIIRKGGYFYLIGLSLVALMSFFPQVYMWVV